MSSDEKATDCMEWDDADETLRVDDISVEYKWKICNFHKYALSQTFSSCEKSLPRNLGKFKTMILKEKLKEIHVKVHLDLNVESISFLYYILIEVDLYDSSGKRLMNKALSTFLKQDKNEAVKNMIQKVDLSDQLRDDILMIRTTVTQYYMNSASKFKTMNKESLTNDISTLFQSKDFSDVIIKVADKVYYAHQNILAVRSKVFKTMLITNIKEQGIKEIVIENMAPEVFEQLLFYIYNDRMSNASDGSLELCNAANMYELLDLRKLCENEMKKNISCENALAIFNYADSVDHKDLKETIVDFILRNSTAFSASGLKLLYRNPAFCAFLFDRYRF